MVWGTIIACYLFLAGLSAGAFLSSVYVEYHHPEKTRYLLVSRIVALVSVCLGLALLIVDAPGSHSNPLSLFYLLCGIKSSVMSWGVVILVFASGVQFLYVLYELMRSKDNWYTRLFLKLKKILCIVGVIASIGLAAYTGLLIGVIKTAPLWNNALLPVLFFVSAISAGIAASQFFGALFARKELGGLSHLSSKHCALLFVELALLGIMLFIVSSGNAAGAQSVALLTCGSYAPAFWLLLVLAGLLLPACVEAFMLAKNKHAGFAMVLVLEFLVLMGGFVLRLLIMKAAVPLDFLGF